MSTEDEKMNVRRSKVVKWLRLNAQFYETATELAEGAIAFFDLDCVDDDHWLWDEAANEHV